MREFTPDRYRKLLEFTEDKTLQEHMQAEFSLISSIENSKSKTFVDLGAGYGRVTEYLSKLAKKVISIEINPNMLIELHKTSEKLANVEVIQGDIASLSSIIQYSNIKNPVFLLLQNTLGTIEGDNPDKLLFNIKKVCKQAKGELILSLFRQEALHDWGMDFYRSIQEMVGEPDFEKIDYSKGFFVSKTSYTSKWMNKQEIQSIVDKLDMHIFQIIEQERYCVLHLSYGVDKR